MLSRMFFGEAKISKTTRTLNPLHFEDFEPHRFEDMVRQLAYDFRPWKSIEATGRLGADEGMDVRAVEGPGEIERADEDENDDIVQEPTPVRLWIIQCKREKAIGPAKVRQILKDSLPAGSAVPYGFILAAACDFSKKARDVFHQELRGRSVQEGHLWGKAELEDMLFSPKYDHLLFAYFNISLQIRRRSLRAELHSRFAIKRKLIKIFGGVDRKLFKTVLLRNAREERYPYWKEVPDFQTRPAWLYATCIGHDPPDHLSFIVQGFFAYVDDEHQKWDALFGYNHEKVRVIRSYLPDESEQEKQKGDEYIRYWNDRVPEENRANFLDIRLISYDRILVVDEFGDRYNEGPHLLVEFTPESGPFEPNLRSPDVEYGDLPFRRHLRPTEENRISFFPKEFPKSRPPAIAEEKAEKME